MQGNTMTVSDRIRHFFHVVSNIRPIVWIAAYVAVTPLFALIYWALPDGQFRIPDGAATDYGSWLYYSIVTITTLGFGDYTPAMGWAQAVTAVEVMCGLILLGFFLNAVGSLKSELDVASEVEKQRRLHYASEHEKLTKCAPAIIHMLNSFISTCRTLLGEENPGCPGGPDCADTPATTKGDDLLGKALKEAARTSLALDSLQSRIDVTLWPELVDDSFAFVANWQMHSTDPADPRGFLRRNSLLASNLEAALSRISLPDPQG